MQRWLPLLWTALFCSVLFIPALADRDLTSSHEARAAQNAQSMLERGNWLLPGLLDRHVELQKPPMYYWLVALLGWCNGGHVNEWAVRLPAALSACVTVLFLAYLGMRTGRPLAGFLAAIILASSVHFTWLARVGRIDMPLTMTITLALGAFHLGERSWQIFGYVGLALGVLLKGPIAIVLAGVVAISVWLVRDRRLHSRTSLWWGVPLTLAVAAPWFVWANWATDNQLFEVFFWYHNVERGLGGAEALATHPWWFYGVRVGVDLLPWSLFVPLAIFLFVRKPDWRADGDAQLGLIWFGAILLFLSCMRFKRADYLLPAYPGLAIFLGAIGERCWHGTACSKKAVMAMASFMILYAGGWLTFHYAFTDRTHEHRELAAEIRRQTGGPVIFFRAESHLLAYHLGSPVGTVLEWENLEKWTRKPRVVYYVMPEACATEALRRLPALEEFARLAESEGRVYVVMRTASSSSLLAPPINNLQTTSLSRREKTGGLSYTHSSPRRCRTCSTHQIE